MNLFDEPLLSADEEQQLSRRIEAGVAAEAARRGLLTRGSASDEELGRLVHDGTTAHQRFVLANLRLVARLAAEESRRVGLPYEELFQEGVIGLLDAVQRWDRRRGVRFSTYAVIRIRKTIHEAALTRCGSIGLPPHAAATWLQVRRAHGEANAGVDDVAAQVALSPGTVRRWLAYSPPQQLPEDWVERPLQPASTEATTPELPDSADLHRRVAELPRQLRAVVELRYGLAGQPVSVTEAAVRLGVSPRQVRRLEAQALARLRDELPLQWAA